MAQTATMHRFEIQLADCDRDVHDNLELRVARHPSETLRYLLVRVLARCLEHSVTPGEQLDFSPGGVSSPEYPALALSDPTGAMLRWIDVGEPAPDRVHKATASAPEVAIYAHRRPAILLDALRAADLRRAERVRVHAFDDTFLDALHEVTGRRDTWALTVADRTLYLEVGGTTLTGAVSHATL